MTSPSQRLSELGLALPAVPAPLAAYVPAVRVAGLVYTSGQLPFVDGTLTATGVLGADLTAEEGAACARIAALNGLAAAAAAAGGLDAISRIVRLVVYVAATADFTAHPTVGNGASELVGSIFGEAGRHARSAVGVTSLPLGSPVEVEIVAEIEARPTVVPV